MSADGNVSVTGPLAATAGLAGLGGEITVRAGGTLTTSAIVRADGGDGGDVELDALGGDITTGADVNASAGGSIGDGGTVTVIASGNVTVNGNYVLPGAGSLSQGGGDGGDTDVEGTAGTVTRGDRAVRRRQHGLVRRLLRPLPPRDLRQPGRRLRRAMRRRGRERSAGRPVQRALHVEPAPGRIPGGATSRDCVAEWALAAGQLAVARNGLPSNKQTCVDNDPSCDFDPTPGNCRFHLWACVGGDDPRLGCAASAVASLGLRRPSASQTAAAAARQALLDAFGRLPLPTAAPGEACSGRVDLDVPAGRKRLVVSADAFTTEGLRDRDSVKLTCVPAP